MDLTIDNSAISLLSCKRKFQLTVIEGLTSPGTNNPLAFGSAFHTAVELIDKGYSFDQSINDAFVANDSINKALLFKVVTLFKATVKLPPPIVLNDLPAIEVKFRYHYGKFITPSGQTINVYLAGTMDRVELDKDVLVIRDYKGGADFKNSSIAAKISSYDLSFQLPVYVHAALNSGILPEEYKSYIINRKYRVEYTFIFYSPDPPQFHRRILGPYNDDFLYREVPLILNHKITEAINIAMLKSEPAAHDGMTVYNACKYCEYRPACLSMGTERETSYLASFDKREYNPLTFR